MKGKRIYRIVIENESRLEKVGSLRLPPWKLALFCVGAVAMVLLLAGAIIWMTPLRSLLPGYMKEGERAATELNLLRLDSLNQAYSRNEEFLSNIRTVLDTDRTPQDSLNASRPANMLTSDSLLPTSPEEAKFVAMMQERERYNISVIAPLAAEGMIFCPVSAESVVTAESRQSDAAVIVLADGAPVESIADGVVIAIYSSLRDGGGNTMIIQHDKGFLSAYSRLTNPTVSPGTRVTGGQTISLQQSGDGIRKSVVTLRMWHDGTPLIPYDYIGSTVKPVRDGGASYEAPRGR